MSSGAIQWCMVTDSEKIRNFGMVVLFYNVKWQHGSCMKERYGIFFISVRSIQNSQVCVPVQIVRSQSCSLLFLSSFSLSLNHRCHLSSKHTCSSRRLSLSLSYTEPLHRQRTWHFTRCCTSVVLNQVAAILQFKQLFNGVFQCSTPPLDTFSDASATRQKGAWES